MKMNQNVHQIQSENLSAIRNAFELWHQKCGGPFDLLNDDAIWEITGRSLIAGVYHGRDEFLDKVIKPFNLRMKEPLSPTVKGIYEDKDMVVVLFDAVATTLDGTEYRNSYSWFLKMDGGKIVEATAFFDSIALNELWERVSVPS